MSTREEKLARRRYLYSLKADKINTDRRAKYAIGRKSGLNYKEARDIRGYETERITKTYSNIRYKKETKKYYIYVVRPKKIDKVLTKAEISNIKKKKRYKKARDLGYTPEEARYLRNTAEEKFDDILSKFKVQNLASRERKWYRMNSKSKYDQSIVDAVEEINMAEGYDPASRYGWAVYYFWYLNGGDIEGWKAYVLADPFNPDSLGYSKENTFSF